MLTLRFDRKKNEPVREQEIKNEDVIHLVVEDVSHHGLRPDHIDYFPNLKIVDFSRCVTPDVAIHILEKNSTITNLIIKGLRGISSDHMNVWNKICDSNVTNLEVNGEGMLNLEYPFNSNICSITLKRKSAFLLQYVDPIKIRFRCDENKFDFLEFMETKHIVRYIEIIFEEGFHSLEPKESLVNSLKEMKSLEYIYIDYFHNFFKIECIQIKRNVQLVNLASNNQYDESLDPHQVNILDISKFPAFYPFPHLKTLLIQGEFDFEKLCSFLAIPSLDRVAIGECKNHEKVWNQIALYPNIRTIIIQKFDIRKKWVKKNVYSKDVLIFLNHTNLCVLPFIKPKKLTIKSTFWERLDQKSIDYIKEMKVEKLVLENIINENELLDP